MVNKKPLRIDLAMDGRQWVARGPGIRVEAPSLQALRHRVRKAVEEVHGASASFEAALHIPDSLKARVDRNRKRRDEIWKARAELTQDTVEILEIFRNSLGASYEDAGAFLGVDAAYLMRTQKTHTTQQQDGLKRRGRDDED